MCFGFPKEGWGENIFLTNFSTLLYKTTSMLLFACVSKGFITTAHLSFSLFFTVWKRIIVVCRIGWFGCTRRADTVISIRGLLLTRYDYQLVVGCVWSLLLGRQDLLRASHAGTGCNVQTHTAPLSMRLVFGRCVSPGSRIGESRLRSPFPVFLFL